MVVENSQNDISKFALRRIQSNVIDDMLTVGMETS